MILTRSLNGHELDMEEIKKMVQDNYEVHGVRALTVF
jgi:hypothetical protein